MKNFIRLVYLLFFLVSCRQAKDIAISDFDEKVLSTYISGSWTICKRKSGDKLIVSNICKTLVLNRDGYASLKIEDELISNFEWQIKEGKIEFSSSAFDKEHFLSGHIKYFYKIYKRQELEYLEITSIDKHSMFYLTRHTLRE